LKPKPVCTRSLCLSDLVKLSAKILLGNSELWSGNPSQGLAPCARSCRDEEEMLLDKELLEFPTLDERKELNW